MKQIRWYGWNKDAPDRRDFAFVPKLAKAKLPDYVLPLTAKLPIWNQGAQGSCTAHGSLRADVFARRLQGTHDVDVMPSRSFQYFNTRKLEGTTASDSGGQIRDAIKALVRWGVCPETQFPYNPKIYAKVPPAACYQAALLDQVLQYRRIADGDVTGIKSALAQGLPVVMGFLVFKQMESAKCAKDGIVFNPKTALESPVGGHCALIDGYVKNDWWTCANSWGTDWGCKPEGGTQRGWFWLPQDYTREQGLMSDIWVIEKVEA